MLSRIDEALHKAPVCFGALEKMSMAGWRLKERKFSMILSTSLFNPGRKTGGRHGTSLQIWKKLQEGR